MNLKPKTTLKIQINNKKTHKHNHQDQQNRKQFKNTYKKYPTQKHQQKLKTMDPAWIPIQTQLTMSLINKH